MPPRICPKCGHDLVFKHGAYGQFIGCSDYPVCKFTMDEDGSPTKFKKEVAEWDEHGKPTSYGYSIQTKPRKPACKLCKGTRLIPFKGRHDAFLHCSCHPVYGDNPRAESYIDIRPDDFDFPLSDTFRGYAYEYCNQSDPGYIPPEPEAPEPKVTEVIHRHSDMGKQEFALLRDLEGRVKYLQGKLTEREKKKEDFY